MEDIEKMQYKNLRAGFNLLVDTILGKDYYNEYIDTYHCDLACCDDLIYAYNHKAFRKVHNPFTNEKINEIINNSIEAVEKENKVEVVKKGTDKEYIITCPRCHPDLKFHLSDIYIDKDKNKKFSKHICCPVCNKSINTNIREEDE
jgi:ATP-dependent RNA circularization protein (DNA/RNA ligase family)